MMKKQTLVLLLLLLAPALLAQSAEEYFKPLKYRNIGPFRGGRSVCASGVPGDPMTYYMGTTGGGLWKTSDAGQHWTNVSDGYFELGSVGAVAVSPSDPNIVYVGMGEHAPRGVMTSYGDGVYKSTDAGKTWKHLGLEQTQHISRILIHPNNPDIVYVAAQGPLYGPNRERGIYKSTDGGQTWKQVLFVNESTGCSELSMDPEVPEVMYATMWEHQRKPEKVISGGPGSGVYKSVDGGESWTKIENGLPAEKGKMAIAVSAANRDLVYLLMESDSKADKGGLFVSRDGGAHWSMVSGDNRLTQRAWYYTEVFADPQNEDVLYVLSAPFLKSIDGGKTFERLPSAHGDYHDLWINPGRSENFILAGDGGAEITFDGGEHWSSLEHLPTGQFYRINTDNLFPYNIYGGQQDNTSVRIPYLSMGNSGIWNADWTASAGGESAFLAFDPDNPRYVMGGSYLGTIEVLDTESRMPTQIMPAPVLYLGKAARDMKYLYNWNAPIIWSQHEPGTFYHCAQLVLRTRDLGQTWEEMSPDLSRNQDDKQGDGGGPYTNEVAGAENYGTIAYMVESPHEKGVFYTGSDDGLVYLTRDGMQTWENVTPKGQGETLVNAIEVSPHDPATVYIATTRYKFNDYSPALLRSSDYGKTWKNISKGIPYGAYTRVVREDPGRKGLLYAGTEKGIYISWNGGIDWEPLQLNLPRTPVQDLKVHQGDLIVATSGRAFWILDDLSVLHEYQPEGEGVTLYTPENAYNGYWGSPLNGNSSEFSGTDSRLGVNPANGITVYYELPELPENTKVTLEVMDARGKRVNTFTSARDSSYKRYAGGPPPDPVLSKEAGLNRFVWDMSHSTMPGAEGVYIEGSYSGHRAIPGRYTFRLTVQGTTYETGAEILPVSSHGISEQQYREYDKFMDETEGSLSEMHQLVSRMDGVRTQLESVLEGIKDAQLRARGQQLLDELTAWDEEMVQRKSKAYDDVINFPNKFTADYLFLINQSQSGMPRITRAAKERRTELDVRWAELRAQAQSFIDKSIPDYNIRLWQAGIGAIRP